MTRSSGRKRKECGSAGGGCCCIFGIVFPPASVLNSFIPSFLALSSWISALTFRFSFAAGFMPSILPASRVFHLRIPFRRITSIQVQNEPQVQIVQTSHSYTNCQTQSILRTVPQSWSLGGKQVSIQADKTLPPGRIVARNGRHFGPSYPTKVILRQSSLSCRVSTIFT